MKLNIFLIIFPAILAGCATKPHFYEGEPRPASEVARVSVIGYARDAGITAKKVDGKSWDFGPVVYLMPGMHSFEMKVNTAVTGGPAYGFAWKEATVTKNAELLPGHTYIPEVEIISDKVFVRIVDVGVNFPDSCMPLRVLRNSSEIAFSSLYKDGTKCDLRLPSPNNIR